MEDTSGKVLSGDESTENTNLDSGSSPGMTGILNSASSPEGQDLGNTRFLHPSQWQKNQEGQPEIPHLSDFFSLFHILEKRRKKEGKIIFESSEPKFSLDAEGEIIDIYKRERGASHMMIEEFMVLANEEVAKWCTKHSLPFLSRVHHLPPEENAKIIREIVGLASGDIHPIHIRQFLDTLSTEKGNNIYPTDEKQGDGGSGVETVGAKKKTEHGGAEREGASFLTTETFDTFGYKSMESASRKVQTRDSGPSVRMTETLDSGTSQEGQAQRNSLQEGQKGDIYQNTSLYKYSRLLLPKMAKAFYSDKAHMHFGLALEYYSHFTSPIRRYPDLQVHRIIKEELHKNLDKKRKEHYRHILKKIAKKCSDGEVRATDVERAMDSIMICRYMSDKIGQCYVGHVSGLTEWAIFVELENGVDVTIYLAKGREKGRYTYDPVRGNLSIGQKVIHTIGDIRQVKITGVNMEDRRVEGELIL